MNNWAITIGIPFIEDFVAEVAHARKESLVKNLKIPSHIKSPIGGDTIYVVFSGAVRGRMTILERSYRDSFFCHTNGTFWDRGNYLVCNISSYEEINGNYPMKSFRGIKKVSDAEVVKIMESYNG